MATSTISKNNGSRTNHGYVTVPAGAAYRIDTSVPVGKVLIPFITAYNNSDYLNITLTLMQASGNWDIIARNVTTSSISVPISYLVM